MPWDDDHDADIDDNYDQLFDPAALRPTAGAALHRSPRHRSRMRLEDSNRHEAQAAATTVDQPGALLYTHTLLTTCHLLTTCNC
jgi:hypothetical protein